MATASLFDEADFTHDAYRNLLVKLREQYTPRPFGADAEAGDLVLHHDVTLSLDDAVTMAKTEADLGVAGTYCVLLTSPLFNPFDNEQAAKIRELEAYGHEVGLQVNPATEWEQTPSEADIEETVAAQFEALSTIATAPSSVVSFHRPPSWFVGREFSGFDSIYAGIGSDDVTLVTDTPDGADWESPPEQGPDSLHLLVHPERWQAHHDDYERIVESCVIDACRYVNRRACEDFVDPLRRR